MSLISTRHWNWWNVFVCWLVSLGQLAFAYPASIIAPTLSEPSFLIYMGLLKETDPPSYSSNATNLIGATSGVFQAGAFFNIFIVAWISDRWGRRAGVLYCSILSLFGGGLLCGSTNISMFIVARFFAGAGSWGFLVVTPIYSSELAPPDLRGLLVGLNGVHISLGYAIASYVGLAFYFAHDPTTQWRAPLGIALLFPVLMIAVCFVAPESPRYLLMKGRIEEAKEVVFKLHAVKGDPNQVFAKQEFLQMSEQAAVDRELNTGWMELFRKPSYRKRCVMGMLVAFIGQSSGVLVITTYGPTIYAALGYGTRDQLIFSCGWITVGVIFNSVGALVMDWTGRRPLLMLGTGGCCVALILEAAMVSSFADTTNQAGLRMGVAAAYIFLVFYAIGLDVAGVVFYSELFPNHIRAKGIALSISVIALTDLIYLQSAATAFAKIGWKFYLIYIIISGLGTFYIYFCIPETKNIPLEEIALVFGDDVAVLSANIHVDHNTHEAVVDDNHNVGHKTEGAVAKTEEHSEKVVNVQLQTM